MSVALPNGVILSLATTYAAADTVSAVTNANPAVATTSIAHGITTGAFVEVTSGWSRINQRIVRATAASGSVLSYEGIDTSSVVLYPAGQGIGSVREISAFTQIAQVLEISSSGGDMGFTNYAFMEQDFESQIPTQASPMMLNLTLADDASLAGYLALKAASITRAVTAMKAVLPSGSIILYNGYVSLNETPILSKNNLITVKASLALVSVPVRYAS